MMRSERTRRGLICGVAVVVGAVGFLACDDKKEPAPPSAGPVPETAATVSSAAGRATVPSASSTASPSAIASASAAASASSDATGSVGSAPAASTAVAGVASGARGPSAAAPSASAAVAAASGSSTASPSAVPAVASAKTVTGSKGQTAGVYSTWMQSSGRFVAGKAGTVRAVVVAKGEFKTNPNYPYKVKMAAPPAGVSYPQPIVRAVSRTDKRAVITVPVVPTSAGPKTVRGTCLLYNI